MKLLKIKIYVLLSAFLFTACSSYENRCECLELEMKKADLRNVERKDRMSVIEAVGKKCRKYPIDNCKLF
tara:strand:+ start:75 stop:284 length:210 start_codon:yes stop_codon:yes gene_type:complete